MLNVSRAHPFRDRDPLIPVQLPMYENSAVDASLESLALLLPPQTILRQHGTRSSYSMAISRSASREAGGMWTRICHTVDLDRLVWQKFTAKHLE